MGAAKSAKASQSRRSSKAETSALADRLAEAGWAEADLALAQALRDLDEVRAASTRPKRAAALDALELALTRAARRRGMSRIGATGDEQQFDPALHEAGRGTPERVQIQARGVRRGDAVLVRALAKRLA